MREKIKRDSVFRKSAEALAILECIQRVSAFPDFAGAEMNK